MYTYKDLTKSTYRPSEVAKMLNIHYNTLRLKDIDSGGTLFERTDAGRRYMTKDKLVALLKQHRLWYEVANADKIDIVYARVSSHQQKENGDLDRQAVSILEAIDDLNNPMVIKDVGSGLNDKRKGLLTLLDKVASGGVSRVCITYKDRLTRFGFNYLEKYCSSHGAKIVLIGQEQPKSAQEELVHDMTSLMASFSGKLYDMRSRHKSQVEDYQLNTIMTGLDDE